MSLCPRDVLVRDVFAPERDEPEQGTHLCAMCQKGQVGTIPINKVVSKAFTSWYLFERSDFICPGCEWLVSDIGLRVRPWLITENGCQVDFPASAVMRHIMNDERFSLLVPLSRQKILAPDLEWGCVTNDLGTFPLDARWQQVLDYVSFFKNIGFQEKDFSAAFPSALGKAVALDPTALDKWGYLRKQALQGDDIVRTSLIIVRRKENARF